MAFLPVFVLATVGKYPERWNVRVVRGDIRDGDNRDGYVCHLFAGELGS